MKKLIKALLPLTDYFVWPFVYPAALMLKAIRKVGIDKFPLCKRVLLNIGIFPITNHYYEPIFDTRHLKRPLSDDRDLPGINWNVEEQLQILDSFTFARELNDVPISGTNELTFYMNNGSFISGDAEYWYNIIRLNKPSKIFEIGSGNSTLMAIKAIRENEKEQNSYKCKHVCIEPYEMPWLEKTGVQIIRQKVEDVDKKLFSELGDNDILFIDSSHVIRPQGDVLLEYLQLLPSLKKGVIVHIHDIFSPKDYLDDWVKQKVYFWNEQYLLEAFLTSNREWKIIGALNFLHHNHYGKLKAICPFLSPDREPGSFYMQKIT